MERDPVCGMMVDPKKAKDSAQHGGKTYYFCALGCKRSFEADPGRYVKGASRD